MGGKYGDVSAVGKDIREAAEEGEYEGCGPGGSDFKRTYDCRMLNWIMGVVPFVLFDLYESGA